MTFAVLLLTLSAGSGPCPPATPTQASSQGPAHLTAITTDNPGLAVYVAQVIAVDPARRAAFVSGLRRRRLPVWQQLRRKGYLASQSVFEVTKVGTALPGAPAWNYLVLSRLACDRAVSAFLRAEKFGQALTQLSSPSDSGAAILRRVEILHSTPNSFYPSPTPSDRRHAAAVTYLVEYIAVHDTAARLEEYRESMKKNSGPAAGELVKRGLFFNFVALETREIIFAQPGMATWNQIHVVGLLPGRGSPQAFDSALRKVNPGSGGYARVFGRLDSIRVHTRVDEARLLRVLQIPRP
ncbi:MAG: hypothetical protein H0W86_08160 [Armatimonadetes bacterium]|nr:hypothetical protein [Armatimonadota bacterium]